jgi:uncharacterized protein
MRIATLLWIAVLLAAAPESDAASFPCNKATTRVEKSICADAMLSRLDEQLGRHYAGARQVLGAGADCLVTDQRRWLREERDRCGDRACLEHVYLSRLRELDGLLSGASALTANWELPDGPVLVWVIPPMEDAAPGSPPTVPMKAVGTLVDEVADGDGFVLRTEEGESYMLILLMFLEGDTLTELTSLARFSGEHRYMAVGHGFPGEGRLFFEPSRCTFLYRLP